MPYDAVMLFHPPTNPIGVCTFVITSSSHHTEQQPTTLPPTMQHRFPFTITALNRAPEHTPTIDYGRTTVLTTYIRKQITKCGSTPPADVILCLYVWGNSAYVRGISAHPSRRH